ncbi:uncharacterized protein [Misgurnus anguillicaudatus]|uniref:uncharacterized protein n=1 Tax=Misgurnus anguillicaudatus TaxID=75329 RepID=UPI003CCF4647
MGGDGGEVNKYWRRNIRPTQEFVTANKSSFRQNQDHLRTSQTMSCRKKSFGRFAAIQLESDNCRKGMEYVPIWKKDFSAPLCLDVYKDGRGKGDPCSNPCNNVTPCHDWGCKKTCKKMESCVPGCSSWSKPCVYAPTCYDNNYKAVDESPRPCGGLPVVDLGSGACGKPVNVHNPCSFLKPCHDIRKIWADSCGMQPSGKEAVGRFPCFKWKPEGACGKLDHERFCFK